MKIFIKNMVSNRCKLAVKKELENLNLNIMSIELGVAEIIEDMSLNQRNILRITLCQSGLELLEDKKSILIEKIKNSIINMVQNTDEAIHIKFSIFLSEKLNHNYTYLANVFSEVEGITIAQFIIAHKVEKIKELISYDECNITEIAWKMHYSSVAHLSNQFKKVTGSSPTHFKHSKDQKRTLTCEVGNLPKPRIEFIHRNLRIVTNLVGAT
jgi:AraC-like DNA-binding protein